MKTTKPFLAIFTASALLLPSLLQADVQKQEDGSFLIKGIVSFSQAKNALFPSAGFDKGDYKMLLFKPEVTSSAPSLKECNKTEVTLKVQARENTMNDGSKTLIVTKVLEVIEGPTEPTP